MKVTGFTFVRNAIVYDYPVVESIRSIFPLCDEVVVAVGNSDDGTLELIQSIDPEKVRIIETVWDDSMREGGQVLAVETDKAFEAISEDTDWAFYIQGDEVIHEEDYPTIRAAMERYLKEDQVDGLLFNYKHFYGSYGFVGAPTSWYPHEIRIVRNDKKIYSYKDAQGFRKGNNEKLNVVPIEAWIYHYGWVKKPEAMQKKQETFNKYWHDDAWVEDNVEKSETYDYDEQPKALEPFKGTHPKVMHDRVERLNWNFRYNPEKHRLSTKDKLKKVLKRFGIEASYANYRIIKVKQN
ncbi:MAG: glycosyl transferase [Fluviicola sp. XM-24bin1]|nr:MAG: glycosyl transferase [Fluviicola sp. XM-24bin1]